VADDSFRKTLSIGELARECGVSRDTLRHYERVGVLPPAIRQANGYRCYDAALVSRVRLVRQALLIGFTLDELSTILKVRDRGDAPCRKVCDLAKEKLIGIEQRLKDLTSLRDQLRATLRNWDRQLNQTQPNERAYLLENLSLKSSGTSRGRRFTTKTQSKRQRTNNEK
jgi:DNA-binding transcriptional MerR regulator